jgi:HK97 gp10 family phage protein
MDKMADGVSIDITGLSEVKAKLDALGTTKANRIVRTALKAGAAIAQEAVEYRAPERVDLPSGTALPIGALRADITVQLKESNQGNQTAIIGPGELTIHVAEWVEEGHRLVRGGYSREVIKNGEPIGKYRGPGSEVGTVEPHPFVRKAYEGCREEVAQAIATTLVAEVEKASK